MADKVILNGVEFEVNVEGNTVVVNADENAFIDYMKNEKELTKAEIKKVSVGMNDYLKAVVDTAVDKAGKELINHCDAEAVNVKFPFGVNKSDVVEVHVQREKDVRIPTTGEVVKKPAIKVAVNTKATRISKSHIRALREDLEEVLAKGC